MKTDSAIAKLQDQKERHRLNAAIWVWSRDAGHFSDEERVRLIETLQATVTADESDAVRSQSILALVRLEAPGSAELALDALRDPDPMARYTVAAGLGPTEDPRIVDQLIALLDDDDGYVREGAALGLSTQNDSRAIDPLRAMLDRGERDSAAKAAAKRAIAALSAARD